MGIEAVKLDRQAVRDEMQQASKTFHHLLDTATVAELSRQSHGTKWTNGQLLFHMLFGYLIVVRLLALVRIFGRLPDGFSRVFASALKASTRPFHAISYFGSVGGPRLLGYEGMGRRFDKVVATLLRRLDEEGDSELSRGMPYPTSWDPYFKAYMTLAGNLSIPDPALRASPSPAHPPRCGLNPRSVDTKRSRTSPPREVCRRVTASRLT